MSSTDTSVPFRAIVVLNDPPRFRQEQAVARMFRSVGIMRQAFDDAEQARRWEAEQARIWDCIQRAVPPSRRGQQPAQ